MDTRNIIEAVKRDIKDIDCMQLPINDIDEEIINNIPKYDQVVICSFNAMNYQNQAKMINMINEISPKTYIISTRNPYDILTFTNVKNYLCLYEYTPNAVRTIVKYLKGEITAKGKLPIKL